MALASERSTVVGFRLDPVDGDDARWELASARVVSDLLVSRLLKHDRQAANPARSKPFAAVRSSIKRRCHCEQK